MLTFELENDLAAMEPRRNLAPRFSGTGSTRLLYLQIKYHPMVMCQMCFFYVIHSFFSGFFQATSILPLPLKQYLYSLLYLKILLLGQNEQLRVKMQLSKEKEYKSIYLSIQTDTWGVPWKSRGQDSSFKLLGVWALSLVGKLRSHKPSGTANNNNNNSI